MSTTYSFEKSKRDKANSQEQQISYDSQVIAYAVNPAWAEVIVNNLNGTTNVKKPRAKKNTTGQ